MKGFYFRSIRKGSPPAARRYQSDVEVELARIYRTRSGLALLSCIRYYRTTVEIRPFTGQTCNARTGFGDQKGKQEGPVVWFSADNYRRSPCAGGAGSLPHEILFHELVHAFRFASDTRTRGPKERLARGASGFFGMEELVAVLATNIFISDDTNPFHSALRRDSDSHRTMEPELAGSFRYFALSARTFGMISRFCRDNPGLTRMLSEVKAKFNPLWAFYTDPDKALRYSMSTSRDADDIEDDIMRSLGSKTLLESLPKD